ncbi:glycosyltransferase [Aquirufa regiilacus]|uniref:Glycosyltransferase n=1 Tax=Aquirufa regiilacus TaxID=3024868 RepID=A0ABU3TST3_9BACT|nr:glycosyltransferase [Aquirufa sp. LEOWEIH-7C]MDU0808907.1 glycosyltransferase [Aquirufa sp. LEOWEIH-7C]
MKILYVASCGGPGGASTALYNLIQGLCDKHEIILIFPQKGSFSKKVENLGVKCIYLPTYYLTAYPPFKSLGSKVKFLYRLLKLIYSNFIAYKYLLKVSKKINPDIIHTNVGPLDIGFKVALKLRIKHVWHLREYQDLDFDIRFFPSKSDFFKKNRHPNNFSISITQDIFDYWHLDKNKDQIIYDGVVANREHTIVPKKSNFFLFVGRIEEAKGVKKLLRVFGEFASKNNDYQLLFAGSGDEKYIQECSLLIAALKLEKRVLLLGQRDDVDKLMEEAVALIVPSRFEGFGFITVEGMYNHCLVIGKNTAGTKEQFDIGFERNGMEIGFRFNTDFELLYNLERVIRLSDVDYHKITSVAYQTVINKYSIEKHVTNIERFYEKLLNN